MKITQRGVERKTQEEWRKGETRGGMNGEGRRVSWRGIMEGEKEGGRKEGERRRYHL